MDAIEFLKYVLDCLVPLWDDACDKPQKRVIFIVDSGTGQNDVVLGAELQVRGFYMIPGVPNTTHITQPTDQNYGRFKAEYRSNIKVLTDFAKVLSPIHIPLLVFGGTYTGPLNKSAIKDGVD